MDATLRVMRRVKGQEDYRANPKKRNAAPIPDKKAKRRILSILGRTGAPIGLELVKGEDSGAILDAVNNVIPEEYRGQVQSASFDQCTRQLHLACQEKFPNYWCMMLDTVHPAITYEHAFFKKKHQVQDYCV